MECKMPEYTISECKDSFLLYVVSGTTETAFQYCLNGFRWFIGILMAGTLINTHVLLDWILEITLIDFLISKLLRLTFDCCLPRELDYELFKTVATRMLSAWLVSLLLSQSLLVILFSQIIYWLFTTYSQFFSKMIVESLTIFYYFMNGWLLLPVSLNLLLSFIYVLDLMFSTEMLFNLLQFRFLKMILDEWGINTGIQKKITIDQNVKNQLQSKMTKYPGLSDEENLNIYILKERYLFLNTDTFIQEQFNELRSYLALQYYAHQSTILLNDIEYFLPLEWIEFMTYRLRVSPIQQVEMFKKYLENDYHGAWRFLSKENPWMSTDPQNISNKEYLFESKNLEFIITIWMVLKNQYQEKRSDRIFKTKVDMFIKILSRVNRLRNQHNNFHENSIFSDCGGDRIGDYSLLYVNLISLISEKHPEEYISINLIKHLLDSFAKSIWIDCFLKLAPEEMHYLCNSWALVIEDASLYSDYHQLFYTYNFSKSHRDDFILKMNILFGKNWLETGNYMSVIDNYFDSTQNNSHSHPYLYQQVFSEALGAFRTRLESYPIRSFDARA